MGIQYKAFHCKRIIIAIVILCIGVTHSTIVSAQNSLFTVENVTVDVTAENSVEAQEQAFEKAQQLAFVILAKRLVSEGQDQNVTTPDSLTLSALIKDYEVTNEKLSSVRYVGTYIFRFNEKAISRLFSLSGVSYTQNTSSTLLVLPVLKQDGETTIWSEDNIWMQAWSRNKVFSRLVPIQIPIGDLADISDIDDDNALRYERLKLNRMLSRYGAKEAAIMIADPQEGGKKLKISIYRTDRGRAEYVQQIVLEAQQNEDVSVLYDRAVFMGNEALQKDWKRKNAFSESQSKSYTLRIPLKDLKQWIRVKQSLSKLPGASDLRLNTLKKIEANVSLNFRGDEARFRENLSRAMLSLGQIDQDGTYGLFIGHRKSNSFYRPIGEKSRPFNATKQTF